MKRPRATLSNIKNGKSNTYGTPATKAIINMQTDLIADFVEDYGNNNEYVLKMWESVKSGSVPVTIVVILVIEGILLATILAYFLTKNGIAKSLRKKRRQERKA